MIELADFRKIGDPMCVLTIVSQNIFSGFTVSVTLREDSERDSNNEICEITAQSQPQRVFAY